MRAKVKPQCLGNLVKSTDCTIDSEFLAGTRPPYTPLPVAEFSEPHNPPPSMLVTILFLPLIDIMGQQRLETSLPTMLTMTF